MAKELCNYDMTKFEYVINNCDEKDFYLMVNYKAYNNYAEPTRAGANNNEIEN